MPLKIKLAVRDWDYLTPLALGEVKPGSFELDLHRLASVPDWSNCADFDAGEVSFSQYVQALATGTYPLTCIPHFLMRGFRHRCILTTKQSKLVALQELAGKRIGLTGWQDSGNTWTRALLRRAGIQLDDIRWYVGRLSTEDPIFDRLGRYARPGYIEAAPDEQSLTSLLEAGKLDAIFTPFMPPGFFHVESPFRVLQPDFRQHELQYYREVGYVPGIHVLGVRPQVLETNPWVGKALSNVLEESAGIWSQKRMKYADSTPWFIEDMVRTTNELSADWNKNGFVANLRMTDDFINELYEQKILDVRVDSSKLFFVD